MRRINVFTTEITPYQDRSDGWHAARLRIAPLVGGDALGCSVFDLPPGQKLFPYHFEYGNEEWLIVLTGTPTLRQPEGEDELSPGDTVCFPAGPAGAHQVINRSPSPSRFLIFATNIEPAASVYPDSNKIGIWPGPDCEELLVRRGEGLDYWDGEL